MELKGAGGEGEGTRRAPACEKSAWVEVWRRRWKWQRQVKLGLWVRHMAQLAVGRPSAAFKASDLARPMT